MCIQNGSDFSISHSAIDRASEIMVQLNRQLTPIFNPDNKAGVAAS